jgi:hypothetical protein
MDTKNRQASGRPEGGEYAAHNRTEDAITLNSRFVDMAPPAIDTELSAHSGEQYMHSQKIWEELDYICEAEEYLQNPEDKYGAWRYKNADVDIPKARARVEVARAEIARIQREKIDPIDAEFDRRGGWNRFFLVSSSAGGHVHSSRSCSSCNYRTSFYWLTDESGKTEDEIVERAGDGACTVCYPSAPVVDRANPRPNPFEKPEVTAARKIREDEKSAREEQKRLKGIFNEDGTVLREAPDFRPDGTMRYQGSEIKTERGAELKAVDHLSTILWRAEYAKAQDRDLHPENDHDRRDNETTRRITEALARKRGQSVEEVREYLNTKAAAKFKRENR